MGKPFSLTTPQNSFYFREEYIRTLGPPRIENTKQERHKTKTKSTKWKAEKTLFRELSKRQRFKAHQTAADCIRQNTLKDYAFKDVDVAILNNSK